MLVLCLIALPFPTESASLPAPRAFAAPERPGEDKAIRALDAWLKLYRTGKIDFHSKQDITKDSFAIKFGVAPKSGLGDHTWAGDLNTILDACVKLDSAEAALAVLEVASIGIDAGKYTYEMAPYEVRDAAEKAAAKFTSAPAKEEFAKAARGTVKAEKPMMLAMKTAGVRCLGLLKDKSYRPVLEGALGDADEIVRVSAAEALGALGDEEASLPLIGSVERENVDAVLVAAAEALRSLYSKYVPKAGAAPVKKAEPAADKKGADGSAPPAAKPGEKPAESEKPPEKPADAPPAAPAASPAATGDGAPPESVRLAVHAAIKALGRTTWRADMTLIHLLDDFRALETVPALIEVLERFHAHPEEIKAGKQSGLVLFRAHEVLVSMTGAVFPADQPEKWRQFWESEKDKIEVTKQRAPATNNPVATVASGFCGIPVQGTRVVFVLDLSGSMDWKMDEVVDGKKTQAIRLDFAKRELCRAIDGILPNAQFSLITFNGNPKPEVWEPKPVPATEKNRERFKKFVSGLRANGGTNLWAGLEEALKIKSLVYGNRYASNVDEVFVLSDGAPSVGDVTDPVEILRLVQESNKFAHVRINTVFISSATPAEFRQAEPRMSITPQDLMRRMAEQNGGKFREL